MKEFLAQNKSNIDKAPGESFWRAHMDLARANRSRLEPRLPTNKWRQEAEREHHIALLELELLQRERLLIADLAAGAPSDKDAFIAWFENLKNVGPGQNSTLFPWLAESATYEEMRWFIQQEVAGEAGFEDLTAMTQVKISTRAKLEMARNYWDEMGRGREPGMHGPMLARIAEEFQLNANMEDIVPEALALGNVMLAMASHRSFAYHSIGALGVIELTAPGRAKLVYEGLKRIGVHSEAQRYYLLHSSLDIKHSQDWNREVLAPLLEERPEIYRALAEGALIRLNAGARCFERYMEHFQLMQ